MIFECCIIVLRASCMHALTSHLMFLMRDCLTNQADLLCLSLRDCFCYVFLCVLVRHEFCVPTCILCCDSYALSVSSVPVCGTYYVNGTLYISMRAICFGTMCVCSISFRVLLFLCAMCGAFPCVPVFCAFPYPVLCFLRSVCLLCGI